MWRKKCATTFFAEPYIFFCLIGIKGHNGRLSDLFLSFFFSEFFLFSLFGIRVIDHEELSLLHMADHTPPSLLAQNIVEIKIKGTETYHRNIYKKTLQHFVWPNECLKTE